MPPPGPPQQLLLIVGLTAAGAALGALGLCLVLAPLACCYLRRQRARSAATSTQPAAVRCKGVAEAARRERMEQLRLERHLARECTLASARAVVGAQVGRRSSASLVPARNSPPSPRRHSASAQQLVAGDGPSTAEGGDQFGELFGRAYAFEHASTPLRPTHAPEEAARSKMQLEEERVRCAVTELLRERESAQRRQTKEVLAMARPEPSGRLAPSPVRRGNEGRHKRRPPTHAAARAEDLRQTREQAQQRRARSATFSTSHQGLSYKDAGIAMASGEHVASSGRGDQALALEAELQLLECASHERIRGAHASPSTRVDRSGESATARTDACRACATAVKLLEC